jgi:lipopolysaccharide transport system ATP-binding protein
MRKIRFDRVSKQFVLKHERPRSLQELFLNTVHLRRSPSKEQYWALSDASFEVSRGEMVGIIGPNGAGKSTVMKLVSRIIEPTSGLVEVVGRVGALLELGAGFHPELTGRENIYLNGSILGLRRQEVEKQLDAIISFAELEQFIDIPVKHYSSGMFVRLGFAVAVHTHPDILLIDEVLSVGDAGFQQKCLEKIAEFRRSECTILYVSHNLASVAELCSKAIWLEKGRIKQAGDPERVISHYVGSVEEHIAENLASENLPETIAGHGPEDLRIQRVSMVDQQGSPQWTFRSGEPVLVHIEYECRARVENPVFSVLLHRSDGLYVSSTNTYNIDPLEIGPINGRGTMTVEIDGLDLYSGHYLLSVAAYRSPDPPYWSAPAHFLDKEFKFRVVSEQRHGVMILPARWKHTAAGSGTL